MSMAKTAEYKVYHLSKLVQMCQFIVECTFLVLGWKRAKHLNASLLNSQVYFLNLIFLRIRSFLFVKKKVVPNKLYVMFSSFRQKLQHAVSMPQGDPTENDRNEISFLILYYVIIMKIQGEINISEKCHNAQDYVAPCKRQGVTWQLDLNF